MVLVPDAHELYQSAAQLRSVGELFWHAGCEQRDRAKLERGGPQAPGFQKGLCTCGIFKSLRARDLGLLRPAPKRRLEFDKAIKVDVAVGGKAQVRSYQRVSLPLNVEQPQVLCFGHHMGILCTRWRGI